MNSAVKDLKKAAWWQLAIYPIIPIFFSLFFIGIVGVGLKIITCAIIIISVLFLLSASTYFGLYGYNPRLEIFNRGGLSMIVDFIKIGSLYQNRVFASVLSATFGLATLVLIFLYTLIHGSLEKVFTCVYESVKLVSYLPIILLIPVASWAAQIVMVIYSVWLQLLLYTCSSEQYQFISINGWKVEIGPVCRSNSTSGASLKCIFSGFNLQYLNIFFILSTSIIIYWSIFLMNAFQVYNISYNFSHRYLYRVSGRIPVTLRAFFCGLRTSIHNHFGSLAFGSLFMSLMYIIKFILTTLRRAGLLKVGDASSQSSCIKRWISSLMVFIVEKFTNKTYIQVAISGDSFLKSSIQVIRVYRTFPIMSIIVDLTCCILPMLGVIFVSVSTGFTVYFFTKAFQVTSQPLFTTLIMTLFSVIVALAVMEVFCTCITTVHHCLSLTGDSGNEVSKKLPLLSKPLRSIYQEGELLKEESQ